MTNNTIKISKFLSYILRHNPQSINLILDTEGWANIDELIERANATGKKFNRQQILKVVAEDDKKRFSLSDDKTNIRAAQGHSLKTVAIDFEALTPPIVLLHGTATRNMESIKQKGLIAGNRQYVHLTENNATATATGIRYGKPVVLTIDSLAMHENGIEFFQADNGVWLTAQVAPEYIRF